MIIASLAKKEISIPLQPMTSAVSSTATNFPELEQEEAAVDLVTINDRKHGANDFIVQVFGPNCVFNNQVNEILHIKTTRTGLNDKTMKTLVCEAFIFNETVFLSSPTSSLLNWADGEFQTCITHLIELAEEKTGCNALVFTLDKHQYKEKLGTVLRAFMYLGFEMVDPSIYRQEPGYVLVGYEL